MIIKQLYIKDLLGNEFIRCEFDGAHYSSIQWYAWFKIISKDQLDAGSYDSHIGHIYVTESKRIYRIELPGKDEKWSEFDPIVNDILTGREHITLDEFFAILLL